MYSKGNYQLTGYTRVKKFAQVSVP